MGAGVLGNWRPREAKVSGSALRFQHFNVQCWDIEELGCRKLWFSFVLRLLRPLRHGLAPFLLRSHEHVEIRFSGFDNDSVARRPMWGTCGLPGAKKWSSPLLEFSSKTNQGKL
jgi:hypothetical protein